MRKMRKEKQKKLNEQDELLNNNKKMNSNSKRRGNVEFGGATYLEFAGYRRAHAIVLLAGPLVFAVHIERDVSVAVGRLAGARSATRMPNGRTLEVHLLAVAERIAAFRTAGARRVEVIIVAGLFAVHENKPLVKSTNFTTSISIRMDICTHYLYSIFNMNKLIN